MPDPICLKIIREMNLREPQEDSLIKFVTLVVPHDIRSLAQERIKGLLESGALSFPDSYARLTFALATGVGKTKLMGAIMAWLFLNGKSKHFVMVSPSSTIYKKMKVEVEITHKKYIFAGLSAFPTPEVITGESAEIWDIEKNKTINQPTIFILTPGQIRPKSGSESERRLRQENEDIGDSFVDQVSKIDDLVVFLDEGHRYGQDARDEKAWAKAITDLNPKIVVEMTATPSNQNTVLYRYDLSRALREGRYIKNVEAVYQHRVQAVSDEEWDYITLREGLKRLEIKKQAIKSFRVNHPERKLVKPIMLIACRDTTHSQAMERWLQSTECGKGKYKGKVLRVDITQSEEEIAKLLEVENPQNEIEIVVNVGMLKEGWDVENVYVIVPLRASVSETLIVQTIGRGLRLPYGERVGDFEVDTLNVLTFGRETIQQVIEAAKALNIFVSSSGPSGKAGDYRQFVVKPLKKTSLSFPTFVEKTPKIPDLKNFHPQTHISIKSGEKPSVTLIELPTGVVKKEEALTIEGITNLPKRLGQLLTKEISEIGGQDKEATRIFKEYLIKAGCKNNKSERRAVQTHGMEILQDVAEQIYKWLEEWRGKQKSVGVEEPFTFKKAEFSAPARVLKIDETQLPQDKAHLIRGWKHSLYPLCRFDTAQELIIAKILDSTKEILWIRNPIHQFSLNTGVGKHYPDFIVIMKNRIIFIESKDVTELRDSSSDAYKKGKEVSEQCALANRASKIRWEYWAIPHDQVTNCATLEDMRVHRFNF